MKIFISWSGPRSKAVAQAMRDWLPNVIQSLQPWMSAEDVDAGARWSEAVAGELQNSSFGIFCMTPENTSSPWLHFEAGAIAKNISKGRAIPYLLDLATSSVQGPLTQFQMKAASRDQTLELVEAVNRAMDVPLDKEVLVKAFDRNWADLEAALNAVPAQSDRGSQAAPTPGKILEEVLQLTRSIATHQQEQKKNIDELMARRPLPVRKKSTDSSLSSEVTAFNLTLHLGPYENSVGKRRTLLFFSPKDWCVGPLLKKVAHVLNRDSQEPPRIYGKDFLLENVGTARVLSDLLVSSSDDIPAEDIDLHAFELRTGDHVRVIFPV